MSKTVLLLNGSPHPEGCTYTALRAVGDALEACGVAAQMVQLGAGPVLDCTGCGRCRGGGCVFPDSGVNEFVGRAREAQGFVFGSPVYYAHPTGRILSFLDRAFYSCAWEGCAPFRGKPGAAVVSARRGGTTAALDVLNKYFAIAGMPTAPSTYWNMVHGQTPQEVAKDLEGLQTMANLGRNLAHMVLSGGAFPPPETGAQTNFIQP